MELSSTALSIIPHFSPFRLIKTYFMMQKATPFPLRADSVAFIAVIFTGSDQYVLLILFEVVFANGSLRISTEETVL